MNRPKVGMIVTDIAHVGVYEVTEITEDDIIRLKRIDGRGLVFEEIAASVFEFSYIEIKDENKENEENNQSGCLTMTLFLITTSIILIYNIF